MSQSGCAAFFVYGFRSLALVPPTMCSSDSPLLLRRIVLTLSRRCTAHPASGR
ncbi:MAG: hypothetical protein ACTFAL_16340 [Candidatus Electronema sp. V4]|uniref:hypothetical protein n=1 Tax=Candidatus Electronema sp. V4 TaxID=3454756 RepID=UPI0040554329